MDEQYISIDTSNEAVQLQYLQTCDLQHSTVTNGCICGLMGGGWGSSLGLHAAAGMKKAPTGFSVNCRWVESGRRTET